MSEQILANAQQEALVRPIIIDVRAWLDTTSNEVMFEHDWRFEGDPLKKGRIDIPSGTAATSLQFHLQDETGLSLSFKSPASEAMWVNRTGCPPTAAGDGGQISFDMSSPNLLKATDANSEECTLYYMLRFDGNPAANGPPFKYDPEIRNGGGG